MDFSPTMRGAYLPGNAVIRARSSATTSPSRRLNDSSGSDFPSRSKRESSASFASATIFRRRAAVSPSCAEFFRGLAIPTETLYQKSLYLVK